MDWVSACQNLFAKGIAEAYHGTVPSPPGPGGLQGGSNIPMRTSPIMGAPANYGYGAGAAPADMAAKGMC